MTKWLLLIGALAACDGGDRYYGGCPDGEACSDGTPDGLVFEGAVVSGSLGGLAKTAVGGTQHVALVRGDTAAPLDLPFTATSDDRVVQIASQEHAAVDLRGAATGETALRILDATTGELFDRKTIGAGRVAGIGFAPAALEVVPAGMPVVPLAGAARVGVALWSGDNAGERLVDDSMAIDLPGATRVAWDQVDPSALPAGPVTLGVTLASGATWTLATAIAAGVDALVQQGDPGEPGGAPLTKVTVGSQPLICFSPVAAGAFVTGATYQFSSPDAEVDPTGLGNCTVVRVAAPGTLHLTATAGGASLTIALAATDAGAKVAPHPRPIGDLAGERAAAVRDAN